MPYVARNKDGSILAVFGAPNDCAREKLRPDDEELRAFLGLPGPAPKARARVVAGVGGHPQLRRSDLEFVRVLDDLTSVLLNKGIVLVTDLPKEAQRKLMQRRYLRSKLGELGGLVLEAEEPGLS
jgi:hypothetical protein